MLCSETKEKLEFRCLMGSIGSALCGGLAAGSAASSLSVGFLTGVAIFGALVTVANSVEHELHTHQIK